MNSCKLISVIIPVYNMEAYIFKCVNSILMQKNVAIEIIIVDDGSTDKTFSICKKMSEIDNRVRVFFQENKGPGLARNLALENAKGDLIYFIDADDYLEEDYLFKMYTLLINSNADLVQSNFCLDNGDKVVNKCKNKSTVEIINRDNIIFNFLIKGNIDNYLWNKLFKVEILNNIRFKKLYYSEDQVFLLEVLSKVHKIICSDISGYHHRIHNTSLCKEAFTPKKLDVFLAIDLMKKICLSYNCNFNYLFTIDICSYASRYYAYIRKINNNEYNQIKIKMINYFNESYPVFKRECKNYTSMQKQILLYLFNRNRYIASKLIEMFHL